VAAPESNSAYLRGASSSGIASAALTARAMWTLSCRMAIIDWRLHFMTGHRPVVKDFDFAQPVPKPRTGTDLGRLIDGARISAPQPRECVVRVGNGDRHCRPSAMSGVS
jgi:hypothetical protein